MVLKLDNTRCDVGIKRYKIKLWREIRATSINGTTTFVDKSELIKRKYEEVVPANASSQRQVEIGLRQINIHDEHMERYKAKKPARYHEQVNTLHQSIKTPSLECKYWIEVEVVHNILLGNVMPVLTLPITVYYANNLARQAPPAYQAGKPVMNNPYAQ